MTPDKMVISRYDANMMVYVVEGKPYMLLKYYKWAKSNYKNRLCFDFDRIAMCTLLGISWLIVKSLHEDKFGVVQRDIHRLTSLLLLTMHTIDKYFRVRNVGLTFETVCHGKPTGVVKV